MKPERSYKRSRIFTGSVRRASSMVGKAYT